MTTDSVKTGLRESFVFFVKTNSGPWTGMKKYLKCGLENYHG